MTEKDNKSDRNEIHNTNRDKGLQQQTTSKQFENLRTKMNDRSTSINGFPTPVRENRTIEVEDDHSLQSNGKTLVLSYQSSHDDFDLLQEMKLLLQIAAPAVIVQFSVLFVFPQTAAAVGKTLGTENLAGFSLGSLVGNLTCVSVMTGALTAADTLLPRAFAAKKFEDMGLLALRASIVCCLLLLVPILPLSTIMDGIFEYIGQDKYASYLASQWIRVYLIGVPAMLLFRVIQSFLNAQNKVWPMVYASVFASYIVQPTLLKVFVPTFGLNGSAFAIDLTQYVMVGVLLAYINFQKPHIQETWPGISRDFVLKAIDQKSMIEFICLSLGGVMSLSEWWMWEITCFIVGTLGVTPLVVHTIAYNVSIFFPF